MTESQIKKPCHSHTAVFDSTKTTPVSPVGTAGNGFDGNSGRVRPMSSPWPGWRERKRDTEALDQDQRAMMKTDDR